MNFNDPLIEHFRMPPALERALKRLHIETVGDLLYHFPRYYGDTAEVRSIAELLPGEPAVIFGRISGLKTKKAWRKKIAMAEAVVEDSTGKVKIVWFHQAYLAKMLAENSFVRVEGRVSVRNSQPAFVNPKIEKAPDLFTRAEHSLYPVYPETKGITSNWIYHAIKKILPKLEGLKDPIPESVLRTYKLPNLRNALIWIHAPKKLNDAQAARKRFSFEEIFRIQLERQLSRHESRKIAAFRIDKNYSDISPLIERFQFEATGAQKRAIETILSDFKKGYPMSRLLEGDVGSGKTAVAAAAAYACAISKPNGQNFGTLQTAYMAPTEILAKQHFESFIKYFSPRHGGASIPINIGLITGGGCRKFPSKIKPDGWTDISRTQLLKWVASGEIAVLVGTHTLIQKNVKFKHLALAIVDEQHRFGTAQRQKLVNKSNVIPHLLSMTATPIPRTLALTLYGDLDLTLLDEMPAGRKRIITEIVVPDDRLNAYRQIQRELEAGRQLFVICPRIDEPDPTKELAIQAKSVKQEAKRLKNEVFQKYEIGILHSKIKHAEKEKIILDFRGKKLDILVATSVVEVGVNIENASLIIIEGAERFGLAQLHQLRGRVLRGTHQPYCFVFSESSSPKTIERLNALKTAKNGFELAEYDLAQRGAGSLTGIKQWGLSDLGMEAVKNIKMVEAARAEAQKLIEGGFAFEPRRQKIHFE